MQRKILFSALTVLSFWFFYKGIPIDVYHSSSTFIVIAGGILTTVLLAVTLFNFFPVDETAEKADMKSGDFGCFLIAVTVVFFFSFSGLLIYNEIKMTEDEIKNYGEYTSGIIIDGSSITTRKADFSNVTIKFKTKDGNEYTTVQDISESEFNNFAQYQEIPIVYSSRYPSILEILKSDADIAKYAKTKIRDLKIADFTAILELKTANEIIKYLNGVNQKWDCRNGGEINSNIYYNNFKKIAIKVTLQRELIYMHNEVNQGLFENEIAQSGFKKMDGLGVGGMLYAKDNYILNKRIERLKNDDENGSMLDFRQITLVDILKGK